MKMLLKFAMSIACLILFSEAQAATPLRFVSTPNPNVFPLLLAMSQNPNLPVTLVPVGTGNDVINAFSAGQGDALLSMTYAAAQDVVTGKIPQLELVEVDFWSGFFMVAPKSLGITQFSQLAGKGVIVAGPTSGGKGGGPDLIFQAAIKRAGMTPSEFKVCYLPVMQAAPMIVQQQMMNSNPACDPSYNLAPSAISLVEPAATGLVMQSSMPTSTGVSLDKAINIQSLFTGYSAWPASELPHGGISVLSSVLSTRQTDLETVIAAYRSAAQSIMAAKGNPLATMRIANIISRGITTWYGQYGLSIPPMAIAASLRSGDLVYRTDLTLNQIRPDLSAFLLEVLGTAPPQSFYHPLVQPSYSASPFAQRQGMIRQRFHFAMP